MPTFNTEKLKKLVSYAIQGAGINKLIELSTLIGIRVEDGVIYLNTTDGTNYLNVSDSCDADALDVTVNADVFSKLISKITSDTVDIKVVDNTLVIDGNGKYTLELVLDEEGKALSFPDKFPKDTKEIGNLTASEMASISTTIKASLDDIAGSVYSSYYFGDKIASTDRCMLSMLNRKVFDEPYMFNRAFVDLMGISASDITISKSDNMLVFTSSVSDNCEISACTKIPDNTSEFNIAGIMKFVEMDTPSYCKVGKAQFLALLDRLSLFVSKFDEGAIKLHFTEDTIEVSSMASNGVESVDITEFKNFKDTTIKVNIDRLHTQLKSYKSDTVEIYYGGDMCIKFVDGDMTQVIALIK